jgi:hypothetical protein
MTYKTNTSYKMTSNKVLNVSMSNPIFWSMENESEGINVANLTLCTAKE